VAAVARRKTATTLAEAGYDAVLADVVHLIESARHASARALNALITATYWSIGRRIVEEEQHGRTRAGYGEALLERLATDLTARFGRGFGRRNLFQMRAFYLAYRKIPQTLSAQSRALPGTHKMQTVSALSGATDPDGVSRCTFPLPWSHYFRLLAVRDPEARRFYETEALRGGWTIRQLDRQVGSQFYERTALSRNKAAVLRQGLARKPDDAITPEEELKDPYVLEFLGMNREGQCGGSVRARGSPQQGACSRVPDPAAQGTIAHRCDRGDDEAVGSQDEHEAAQRAITDLLQRGCCAKVRCSHDFAEIRGIPLVVGNERAVCYQTTPNPR
jgi:hypothetical protein